MPGSSSGLVVDIRGVSPAFRRPLILSIIDKMVELEADDSIVLICDHEPAGLGYQLELRKETKGRYEFFYDQRYDGAWVALIRKRM